MREAGYKEIRFRVIYRFRDRYPVQALCELLGVPRSGYYKWLSRQGQPDKDELIANLIMQCQEKHIKLMAIVG